MSLFGLLLQGAWHVLLAGLILGAGIPAVYALGIRALAWGSPVGDTSTEHTPSLLARAIAILCFATVIAAIGLGIGIIVAHGFHLQFTFGWPLFVPR